MGPRIHHFTLTTSNNDNSQRPFVRLRTRIAYTHRCTSIIPPSSTGAGERISYLHGEQFAGCGGGVDGLIQARVPHRRCRTNGGLKGSWLGRAPCCWPRGDVRISFGRSRRSMDHDDARRDEEAPAEASTTMPSWRAPPEASAFDPDSSAAGEAAAAAYYQRADGRRHDLDPIPPEERTWSAFSYLSLWVAVISTCPCLHMVRKKAMLADLRHTHTHTHTATTPAGGSP